MRAIAAERFGGYQNLKLADIPKPAASEGRVQVRMTAAGVTPLDDTILSAAAGLPVAYLTALMALRAAGFQPGKTVFAPAIGGSVGNAVTQAASALGAKHAISSTTSHAKAAAARKLGFSEVVDLSAEGLAEGVRRPRMVTGRTSSWTALAATP
jgi:NADPH:quinone reductase-like Zn-dependent oxidoreductase